MLAAGILLGHFSEAEDSFRPLLLRLNKVAAFFEEIYTHVRGLVGPHHNYLLMKILE